MAEILDQEKREALASLDRIIPARECPIWMLDADRHPAGHRARWNSMRVRNLANLQLCHMGDFGFLVEQSARLHLAKRAFH
jgi:hypothetical protein